MEQIQFEKKEIIFLKFRTAKGMVMDGSPVNLETFLRYLSFLYILELDNIFSFHNKIYFRAILLMTTQKVGSGGTKSQFSGANFIFRWF